VSHNIVLTFYEHSLETPNALALSVDGRGFTYKELAARAQKISRWLQNCSGHKPIRVGILGNRSADSCAAILGIGWAGGSFIPISLKLPEDRLSTLFALSELDALIVDDYGTALLSEAVLASCPSYILMPGSASLSYPGKSIGNVNSLPQEKYEHAPAFVKAEAIAYTIFTSGTTGVPKGVEIPFQAIGQHVRAMQDIYALTSSDRLAQTSDLSFDVGLSNIFMAWNVGAPLYIVPQSQIMAPAKFIRDHRITFWFSVPAIIHFMQSLKMLEKGTFPDLRCSVFAGEPLLLKSALAWKEAAPNSVVDNIYGPTEGTVVCVGQRLPDEAPFPQQRDIVALGKAFTGSEIAIVDENLHFLPPDEPGEIALSGLQLAAGYFRQPELTDSRFPMINGKRWYLTGDKGVQDAQGIAYHLGRLDHQVKVLGYRVELEDIEVHLRAVSGSQLVAAVAWPFSHGSASGTVGFVSHASVSPELIRELLKERLPTYMVPNHIYIRDIPLTANGKIDRNNLLNLLSPKTEG